MNPSENHRVLVIDDNAAIHEDFRKVLNQAAAEDQSFADKEAEFFGSPSAPTLKSSFTIDSAFQGQEGLKKVQQALAEGRPYALAFVDVRMPPGWDGVETIKHLWAADPQLQVVICTAYSDYSWDQMVSLVGTSDSLVILKKPFDNVEVLQLAHALTKKWFLTQKASFDMKHLDTLIQERTKELQGAYTKLKGEMAERSQAEDRFTKAFRSSPLALAIQSLQGGAYVDANDSFLQMTGFSRDEIIHANSDSLNLWANRDQWCEVLRLLRSGNTVRNSEMSLRTKNGETREILLSMESFLLDHEPHALVIAQDITERLRLENQLRQAQKMEAVGQLAAGIAHDFNNLLTVIQGHAAMHSATATRNPSSEVKESFAEILSASERAATLVEQLLAFSRKQMIRPKTLQLHEVVAKVSGMLARVVGEHISLSCTVPDHLPPIYIDPCNLDQVIMNLCVNARDAMPKGGKLTISATLAQIDEERMRQNPEAHPGTFVRLSVCDTGCGMDAETKNRIFEPFFTTKGVGKGTGLGLSTVYGILKQHNGWIEVESNVGVGTQFHLFFPIHQVEASAGGPSALPSPMVFSKVLQGSETILLVEDEPLLRKLVAAILSEYGYNVIEAADGVEALEIWEVSGTTIDLLLTDMVMPRGLTGSELAEKLLVKNPRLKVIYQSGYSVELVGTELTRKDGNWFIAKPYLPVRLAEVVRECLNTTEEVPALATA